MSRDSKTNRRSHDAQTEARRIAAAADKAARREANRAAHAARNEEWRQRREAERAVKQDPLSDPFTIRMATKLGITPQDFLDLQKQRREEMAKVPPYEEQLERFRRGH